MQNNPFQTQLGIYIIAICIVVLLYLNSLTIVKSYSDIPYPIFKTLLENGEVDAVSLQNQEIQLTLKQARSFHPQGEFSIYARTFSPVEGDSQLFELLDQQGVEIVEIDQAEKQTFWSRVLDILPNSSHTKNEPLIVD